MKTSKLFFSAIIMALVFVSCDYQSDPIIEIQIPDSVSVTTVIDFEDIILNEDSIWNGEDGSGQFKTKITTFQNHYNTSWFSWSGFACSAKTDTITEGYANQYSVSAGEGANGSKKFALTYGKGILTCDSNSYGHFNIKSIMLTNSTYAYLDMKNGSPFSKKFGTNDWFKVTIKGYLNEMLTDSVDYYLSDFRDGKSFLSNSWKKVDVSSLGKVDKVTFNLDSSDKGDWGMNTPGYICIDNIEFFQTFSTK